MYRIEKQKRSFAGEKDLLEKRFIKNQSRPEHIQQDTQHIINLKFISLKSEIFSTSYKVKKNFNGTVLGLFGRFSTRHGVKCVKDETLSGIFRFIFILHTKLHT